MPFIDGSTFCPRPLHRCAGANYRDTRWQAAQGKQWWQVATNRTRQNPRQDCCLHWHCGAHAGQGTRTNQPGGKLPHPCYIRASCLNVMQDEQGIGKIRVYICVYVELKPIKLTNKNKQIIRTVDRSRRNQIQRQHGHQAERLAARLRRTMAGAPGGLPAAQPALQIMRSQGPCETGKRG